MASIYVSPYRFMVYKKYRVDDLESLDSILVEGSKSVDLLMVVREFAEEKSSLGFDISDSRIFRVEKSEVKGRVVRGRNIGGEYGYMADSINVRSRSITRNKRTKDDADMIPMYFHIFVPKSHIGVAFFQSFQNLSTTTKFMEGLKRHFQRQYPAYTFAYERAIDGEQLSAYSKRIREIVLTKYSLLPQMHKSFHGGGLSADQYEVELVVRPTKRTRNKKTKARLISYFPTIFSEMVQSVAKKELDKHSIIQLPGFKADDVKVRMEHDGHISTVNLDDPYKILARIDVSDVRDNTTGHADYEKIYKRVLSLQDKYVK